MSEDVSSKVKKIVADHLGIDESKVTEESSFIDDLGADSLDTVELVMAFEEEFGSEISKLSSLDNKLTKVVFPAPEGEDNTIITPSFSMGIRKISLLFLQ